VWCSRFHQFRICRTSAPWVRHRTRDRASTPETLLRRRFYAATPGQFGPVTSVTGPLFGATEGFDSSRLRRAKNFPF
jgi:hypothetical protein